MGGRSWDPNVFPAGWLVVRYTMFALAGAIVGAATAGVAFGVL